jgi:hypothetical protein
MASTDTLVAGTLGTTFRDAVGLGAFGAIFGNSQALLQTLRTAFGDAIGGGALGAVFGNSQALLQALGAVFRQGVEWAEALKLARFGFAEQRLWIALRQGKSTCGQAGENQCGEDLLFHV